MPCHRAFPARLRGRRRRTPQTLAVLLAVMATAMGCGGCDRSALPTHAPTSDQAGRTSPTVPTRGPDDAALTTADATRPQPATTAPAPPLDTRWRSELLERGEAILALPVTVGSVELPARAIPHIDALARLMGEVPMLRLSISVRPAGRLTDAGIDRTRLAQVIRLALVARGVAPGRLVVAPAVGSPDAAGVADGAVQVQLRRLANGHPALQR